MLHLLPVLMQIAIGGAAFFLVWRQNRGRSRNYAEFGGPRDIGGLFGLPLENVFLVKVNYWFSR